MGGDRELLELAAKAAEILIEWHEPAQVHFQLDGADECEVWNPLEDDGDALRLAVKLDIGVMSAMYTGRTCAWQYCKGRDGEFFEEHGADAGAATRRAIVRAAAEIGRAM